MPKDQSKWLVGVLPQHWEVIRAERIGCGLVLVERKNRPSAIIGIVSCDPVRRTDLEPLLAAQPRPDFILNMPNNASWSGEAITKLENEEIAFGKMYDLYRGLNTEDNLSDYKNPEFYFVERIFKQHQNVVKFERQSDRVYRIIRHEGKDLIIALSQDYEVTADVVRTIHSRHEPFDIILKSNPYGRISSQGRDIANTLGIEVISEDDLHDALAQ